ncbi:MAG: hypothetical protein IJD40_08920 [Lachnospiraceae bacterium]|nr:hypothetical protein [Lachnospiraceae bacterium]
MERKPKNLISILLLTVGVIFILVAGSIFVTTAWKYLPVLVKQMALLVVSAGMFGGSFLISKNGKLGWISTTLFHLGNAFIGFFVIAVLGGFVDEKVQDNMFRVFAASCAMAIPIVIKLLVKKQVFDFVTLIMLTNIAFVSGCAALEENLRTYMYLLTGLELAMALLDYNNQKANTFDKSFRLCVGVVHLIQTSYYFLLAFLYNLPDDGGAVSTLFMAVVVAVTGVAWVTRKALAIRVWNSIASFLLVPTAVFDLFHVIGYTGSNSVIWLLVIIIEAVIMIWLARGEMIGLLVAIAVVIPYGQLLCYWLDAWEGLFGGMEENWSATYYPYSIVLGLAFAALYVVRYGNVESTWKESKMLKFAGVQLIAGCMMWIASKMPEAWTMVFFLLIALDIFMVGVLFKNKEVKQVFNTIALPAFIVAMMLQPFVEIPDAYAVEWNCFLIAIGIVLFRSIWYDKKETFSIIYFVLTCVLLGVVLLSDLVSGGIGNVLILGLTGIAMLIIASIKNNKKYVVASSVTLILLVLYLTREFWLSIAWWVYLFVAGVVLVILAIKKAKEA